MTDDDRIAHLMGESTEGLDEADRAALDDLRTLLADPCLWAAPGDDLEDRVIAAIAAEAGAGPVEVAPVHRQRTRWRNRWLVAAAAAAAVVVGAALLGGLLIDSTDVDSETRLYVALAALVSPGPSGSATLTHTDAGWRIELDVVGLPRLDGRTFYQAWLKNAAGVLVPVGTFNQGGHITLWAGVSPLDYPAFSVTVEAADGDLSSSGQRVLAGTVTSTRAR